MSWSDIAALCRRWIEQIYSDNGLWPTVATLLIIIAAIVLLAYLDINPGEWIAN